MPGSLSRRRLFLVAAGAAATVAGGVATVFRPNVSAGVFLDAPGAVVEAEPGHALDDTGADCILGDIGETTWFTHKGGEAIDPSELYLTRANSLEREPVADCMDDDDAPFEAGSRLIVNVPTDATVHLVWSPTGRGTLAPVTAVVLATVRLGTDDDA